MNKLWVGEEQAVGNVSVLGKLLFHPHGFTRAPQVFQGSWKPQGSGGKAFFELSQHGHDPY